MPCYAQSAPFPIAQYMHCTHCFSVPFQQSVLAAAIHNMQSPGLQGTLEMRASNKTHILLHPNKTIQYLNQFQIPTGAGSRI